MIEEPLNEMVFTPRDTLYSMRPHALQPNPDTSVPRSHPTKLVNQMKHLNAVSQANKPGFHAKLQSRLAESVLSSSAASKKSSFANSGLSCSIDASAFTLSKEKPSTI